MYDLTDPCGNCPFRTDRPFRLRPERVREILTCGAEFHCHKTVDYRDEVDDDGNPLPPRVTKKSQHCAGVLIILEKEGRPHQMMRIMERVGKYDRTKLNMMAPVYDSIEEAVADKERLER